jgi:DTW domain-containing protein YfiP
VCWCGDLRPVDSQTHVVFIQHPRETKVPISTCRMAHLSLPNSELHIGLSAVGNPRLEALCASGEVAVLFPSDGATDVATLARPPKNLVVVDGTWSNAKKVVEKCPLLSTLPRLSFQPEKPGNYRIRKEPEAHCLSTIEAVTYVLESLEKSPGRFVPLLQVFDAMVDRQLAHIGSTGQTRHKFTRKRNNVPFDPTAELLAHPERLVVVFGEANAWPLDRPDRPAGDETELVQLVAERVTTGERFESMLQPLRPLGPTVAFHLDVKDEALLAAPARAEVTSQWKAFLRPDDLLIGWGSFCHALLEAEGVAPERFVNLRGVLAQVLHERPGSVEARAGAMGVTLSAGRGRAVRRLEALIAVTRAVLDGRIGRVPGKVSRRETHEFAASEAAPSASGFKENA